jgi:HAD superfamily hydrolase (TIGR01662 family)
MSRNIEAIFLDTGNTMRTIEKDPSFQYSARKQIAKLLGTTDSPDDFCDRLREGYNAYKKQAKETLVEASLEDIWTRWMLPDFPAEKIAPLAEKLTRLWLDQIGHRVPRPDVKPTVIELSKRGYILGIISNTMYDRNITDWLEADGLTQYFKALVLSSRLGIRKPNPGIYLEAARQAGVELARCAYVGDNPSRDIQGARLAGFKLVVILLEADTLKKEPPKVKERPDIIIYKFNELLNIFPPR